MTRPRSVTPRRSRIVDFVPLFVGFEIEVSHRIGVQRPDWQTTHAELKIARLDVKKIGRRSLDQQVARAGRDDDRELSIRPRDRLRVCETMICSVELIAAVSLKITHTSA